MPHSKPATVYTDDRLNHIAFPLGGVGTGMICLNGTGGFSNVSLRHKPDIFSDARMFSALSIRGGAAKVLEGQVPKWKIFGRPGTGNGLPGSNFGLPRFRNTAFSARFPFGTVELNDPTMPVSVEITGWSPFIPGDADASSLPVAAVDYRFTNTSNSAVEAVYSFHSFNLMAVAPDKDQPRRDTVLRSQRGFILDQQPNADKPYTQGAFCAEIEDEDLNTDCAWFRGGWWDPLTVLWQNIEQGVCIDSQPLTEGDPSPGASLYLPFNLYPGQTFDTRLLLSWYVPHSDMRIGGDPSNGCCEPGSNCEQHYRPWYAAGFDSMTAVADLWRRENSKLHKRTQQFTSSFYDTTLPADIVDAVAANLAILKSPTVLRQADGRLWAFEGCGETSGCCHGTCTHVWNYAQAIPHLFPSLERTLRETEFMVSQDDRGHQTFRTSLPIRTVDHGFHAAADGQLGGIMKVYREWRISGDTEWMRMLWPRVRQSLDYCIETWDPDHTGTLVEPHHNTYDIEFWGPNGMCTSFYLGALQAAIGMGEACGDDVRTYAELLAKGRAAMESDLWNGEYFIQKVKWQGLRAPDPSTNISWNIGYSPEALAILEKEGPKYQYGDGCLSDGVLGAWIAAVCGMGEPVDADKITSHLASIHRYNLKHDLTDHANPQRPGYGLGNEGGLLVCTWPRGNKPTLPFVYCDEVWTALDYHVASHLIMHGKIDEGLEIVRTLRQRFDGTWRNPFDEYECGHWYGRAMASYALLQSLSGTRYDAVTKTLHIHPPIDGDFRAFIATETGYGSVGIRKGEPYIEVASGKIEVAGIDYVKA